MRAKNDDDRQVSSINSSSSGSSSSSGNRPIKVVIYNHDGFSRRLRHAHNTTALLHSSLLPLFSSSNTYTQVHIDLLNHQENRPICDVVAVLTDADALITPHGFSGMLAGFLPPESLLVEIMPYRFGDPTYGRLASACNLQYMHVVSEPVRKLQVKEGGREGKREGGRRVGYFVNAKESSHAFIPSSIPLI